MYAGTIPLSSVLAETLAFARRRNDLELASFCEAELVGYDTTPSPDPAWRFVQAYVSATARLNPQYIGFTNASAAFSELEADPEHFHPKRLTILFPVSELERKPSADPAKTLLTMTLRLGDFVKDAQNPEAPVFAYFRADSFSRVLSNIRTELAKRLLNLLPKPKG